MKISRLLLLLLVLGFTSCGSVSVATDYDSKTDFKKYKTFAFYKKGIDKARISDLDKRRVLRAIETQLLAKGYVISETPDVLVSIFAKSREKVQVAVGARNPYFSNFWFPDYYFGRDRVRISKQTEGTLFIDLIDANTNELLWQGIGSGALGAKTGPKKDERIQRFVQEILNEFPPEVKP